MYPLCRAMDCFASLAMTELESLQHEDDAKTAG